jgi:hypothetical protein
MQRGRPTLYGSQQDKKAATKAWRAKYRSEAIQLSVSRTLHSELVNLKNTLNLKSLGALIQQLLVLHPQYEASSTEEEEDEEKEDEEISFTGQVSSEGALKMAVIGRLVAEGGISILKLPFVLTLTSLYHTGEMGECISSSTADLFKKVFQLDMAMLVNYFKDVERVHLEPDCSTRQGQERLNLYLTGWKRHKNVARGEASEKLIYSGALTQKTGVAQLDAVVFILTALNVLQKLGSLTSDGGKDVCMPGGLFGLLEKRICRPLIRVEGDLHIRIGKRVKQERTYYRLMILIQRLRAISLTMT